MRMNEAWIGVGLIAFALLGILGLDHGHSVVSLELHRSLWFRCLTVCSMLIGVFWAASALASYSFGRRLSACLAVACLCGSVMAISAVVKSPTPGAVWALTLVAVSMRTALGLGSDG